MVFIITNDGDQSACKVIDWLNFYQSDYASLSSNDILLINKIDDSGEVDFSINDETYSTQDISYVWYRRGDVSFSYPKIKDGNNLEFLIGKLVEQENKVLQDYFIKKVFSKNSLSSFSKREVNKLEVLYKAKEIGLTIPLSRIINNKKELIEFYTNCDNGLITKVVSPALSINTPSLRIYGYTELIDKKYIDSLSDLFYPSFFQENIHKKFEIRSFFIEEEFYSMAIFSQENEKTKIDFRHYDDERPNRYTAFKLPYEVEQKLLELMIILGLNSGSIDLIYGKDQQFYFIEVNPVGQYDMISVPCNMYLHKRIAEFLIEENGKN